MSENNVKMTISVFPKKSSLTIFLGEASTRKLTQRWGPCAQNERWWHTDPTQKEHPPASSKWPFDSNGGHVFSPEKVTYESKRGHDLKNLANGLFLLSSYRCVVLTIFWILAPIYAGGKKWNQFEQSNIVQIKWVDTSPIFCGYFVLKSFFDVKLGIWVVLGSCDLDLIWKGGIRIFSNHENPHQQTCRKQSRLRESSLTPRLCSWPGQDKQRYRSLAGWWFQIFLMFTPIWGICPIWLIFFKGVETTN